MVSLEAKRKPSLVPSLYNSTGWTRCRRGHLARPGRPHLRRAHFLEPPGASINFSHASAWTSNPFSASASSAPAA